MEHNAPPLAHFHVKSKSLSKPKQTGKADASVKEFWFSYIEALVTSSGFENFHEYSEMKAIGTELLVQNNF